jgi:calcineurin-like phosphoesterase
VFPTRALFGLRDQARLADAGLTGNHDHRRPTTTKMVLKRVELMRPADNHRTHERGEGSQQEAPAWLD